MATERQRIVWPFDILAPMKNVTVSLGAFALAVGAATLWADNTVPVAPSSESTTFTKGPAPDTRYGLWNLLDHPSSYGQGAFPEPFLVDDSDLEASELRLDWLRTRGDGTTSDRGKAELEKGFGLVTLELEVPYERNSAPDATTEGFDNINLGARCPFYQFVSPGGFIDLTLGSAIEVGVPTGSSVSKNTELVPKLFGDLKVWNFTLQSVIGYSTLFGPGDAGGLRKFEYGFVFGYTIEHKVLPLPGVQRLIPVFEISGETELNKNDPGFNTVLGNAAIRVNLNAIGPVQPRLGLGFVFPMNENARQDVHSGVFTSLVFEY
jgi:hypothetical protein